MNDRNLATLFHTSNTAHIEFKLNECIKLGLLQVVTEKVTTPEGQLDDSLNKLLMATSKEQKALLSDSQGFCIVNHGFTDEMSEGIPAMSVEIATLHRRRAEDTCKALGVKLNAWSLVDISGESCLGFWPLNIGEEVFVLVIQGEPLLQNTAIISLAWVLYSRYVKNKPRNRRRQKKNV